MTKDKKKCMLNNEHTLPTLQFFSKNKQKGVYLLETKMSHSSFLLNVFLILLSIFVGSIFNQYRKLVTL